jgi:hypothetical protein
VRTHRKALRRRYGLARVRSVARIAHTLEKAMRGADRRGYTGMVGSKGGLFDDPRVKAAMRAYDKALGRFG